MALDPSAYIGALQQNIRQRPLSWEGAVRAKTITDADLKKIKGVDKVRKEQRKQALDADTKGYVALFLGDGDAPSIFQAASQRPELVQYLLVLAGDLIEDNPDFVSALIKHPNPYQHLLPLLKPTNPDDTKPQILILTSALLSKLLSAAVLASDNPSPNVEDALTQLYLYLAGLAKSSDAELKDIAVQEFSAVLRTKFSRALFWKLRKDTVAPLFEILRAAAGANSKDSDSTLWSGEGSVRSVPESGLAGGVGIQLLYHVLLVLWQLSFEGTAVGDGLQDEHDILILYVHLLRISPKEKATRLLLSTLVNLLSTNRNTLLPTAVLARLPAALQIVSSRHHSDPDLLEDLTALTEMIDEYTKTQTTFDEYAAEVRSGHLRWSPPHRSATFWSENARRIIEENNGELPRKLAEILGKPWDTDKQVLAIGCNDIACLVKEVPEKRPVLERLGLKARVMELMVEPDETVRWESLRAVGEWLRYSFE
ncbi:vacuolar ATP synthase subunit H [Trichodelitschia bisporula]|uniref:V-type proton ATPase subunit H n=1 Tax=Trichodelitschia bisporula TaxID=703511 RepID=A0A6G1HYF8_9PEZI|nr:vacuolar ATP synthase subunit H [Trichodelitschia bisporula]